MPVSPETQKLYEQAIANARKKSADYHAQPKEHYHVWQILDLKESDKPWVCSCGNVMLTSGV